MSASSLKTTLFAACVAAAGSPCLAQWAPDASANLGMGMGGIAVGQSIMQGTRNIGANKTDRDGAVAGSGAGSPAAAPRLSQEMIDAHLKALRPEYDHRVARDGVSAANRWLAETARELGRREGIKARQSQ